MNWKDTQLVYHALARKNEECLILDIHKDELIAALVGLVFEEKEVLYTLNELHKT